MQVIFLNRFFFPDHSATSQMLSDVAFHLAKSGREVQVITSRLGYENPDLRFPAHEVINGVTVHRVWSTRFGRHRTGGRALDYLTFYLAATIRLLQLARSGDIVIAKTDPPLLSVLAAFCCRARDARLINWLQDLFPEVAGALGVPFTRGWIGDRLLALRNHSLRIAVMNIVPGERMAQRVTRQGPNPARVIVIPNWANGQAIRPVEPAVNPLREQWGLAGKFVVGYSGNLGRAHDVNTLVGTIRELQQFPDIVFLFIGAGQGLQKLADEIRKLQLGNVQFRPYQPRDKLGLSLTVPDVHIVTLRPELEGLVVPSKFYGAIAAGRPIVFVGDVDGEIARLIARHGCGFVVSAGDSQQLAKGLRHLRDSSSILEETGRAARQCLDEHYDQPMAMDRWTRLVANLESETSGGMVND